MVNNFKEPNLKAPRFRPKRITLLNKNTYKEFKERYPMFKNIADSTLKEIIKVFNKRIWEGVIENRDGVELPNSLGYLFIGTCKAAKTVNINYALSKKYGKVIQNHNWDTDGNLGKIFYTNYTSKYRFKNRELWRFQAHRDFKRTVAKVYPKQWNKYIYMNNKNKVCHLYKRNGKNNEEELKKYNEFEF